MPRLTVVVSLMTVFIAGCTGTGVPSVSGPGTSASPPATASFTAPSDPLTPAPSASPVQGTPDPSWFSATFRTFQWSRSVDGVPVGCDTIGVDRPVFGLMGGRQGAGSDETWLKTSDGLQLSIVWPAGFTVTFAPALSLVDEGGETVAHDGDSVVLQVSRKDAAGTHDDPYFASGILRAGSFKDSDAAEGVAYQGCYPLSPAIGLANWWVDPVSLPVETDTRSINGIISEVACASGYSPERRMLDPVIDQGADSVVVTFKVLTRPGPQSCPTNPEFAVVLDLNRALGGRSLLDGSVSPPRDATTRP